MPVHVDDDESCASHSRTVAGVPTVIETDPRKQSPSSFPHLSPPPAHHSFSIDSGEQAPPQPVPVEKNVRLDVPVPDDEDELISSKSPGNEEGSINSSSTLQGPSAPDLSTLRGLPATSVTGQSIFGLFLDIDPSQIREECRFSNGHEVDLEHYLHSLIEGPLDKLQSQKYFDRNKYTPSDALIVASVNCFSRKKKRHFFQDGLYLCSVFAKEMSMTLSEFLRVRGWLVKNKKGTLFISYRRIGDCLRLLGGDGAANYMRVSAMFDRLYRVLQSRDIWPEMPYEESKQLQVVGESIVCFSYLIFFAFTYSHFDISLALLAHRNE